MEELRQWGFAVCAAAITGGMVQILSPDKAMSSVFRMSLGAFFLCCLLSPFLSFAPDLVLDLETPNQPEQQEIAQDIESEMNAGFYTALNESLVEAAEKNLEELGIIEGDITVYITEGHSTLTPEDMVVEIVLPNSYRERHEEISRYLIYELGITVRMGYS